MTIRALSCVLPFAAALLAPLTTACRVDVYNAPKNPNAEKIQRVSGPNYLIHPLSNQALCLDVRGDKAAANTEVWLYNCHGKENQRWTFVDKPGDASNVVGVGGLCLDVAGNGGADGTPVNIHPCGADQANQTFRHFGNGQFREVATGKCLGVAAVAEGQRLSLNTCFEGDPTQTWVLTQ